MSFWKDNLIATLENDILNNVNKAQYKMANTWYDCITISSGTIGDYRFLIFEVPVATNGTITALRIVDGSANVIAEKIVNVTKNANKAFSFRIKFKIRESEEI